MPLRMTEIVFRDENGVVHYRQWESPTTCCGESTLRFHHGDCCPPDARFHHGDCCPPDAEGRYCEARSIRIGDGLPLSRVTELPPVTCMLCLVVAEDPAWA